MEKVVLLLAALFLSGCIDREGYSVEQWETGRYETSGDGIRREREFICRQVVTWGEDLTIARCPTAAECNKICEEKRKAEK